jgi:hypothetical protein
VNYRRCQPLTLLGKVVYERAYYHCALCGTGHCLTDAEFGLEHKQTAAAREVLTLAGTLEPFAETGDTLLPRLSGISVSASTVQRTTEEVGADVARRRAAGEIFGNEAPWKWHTDAQGQQVGYVSLDATGVLQQGPDGKKAEGRMAWVGAVFNPAPPCRQKKKKRRRRDHRLQQVRYVSGLLSLPEVGTQLRNECLAAGIGQANVVIALTDGGNGLEECLLQTLAGLATQVVFILDFFHVVEHLREFAKFWITAEEQRRAQVKQWRRLLKRQGGQKVLEVLSGLDLSAATAQVNEQHRILLGYLKKNLHRTDYPTYVANAWHIGSGVIEAACKSVVGRRLKCSGMRWSERQTTPLCQLRALYRSSPNLWADYWQRISRKTCLQA